MGNLKDCNPLVALLFYTAVLLATMFTMNPVILLISLIGAVVFLCMTDTKGGVRQHLFYILIGLAMTLINPLFSHNGVTVLFILNDNPVTLEALIYGLVSSIKILATLYWFRSFSCLMTEDRLLYCLGRVSPKTALLLSMAIRYVPLFGKQMKKVNDAQKTLGLYRDENMIDRVRGGLRVFNILVTWALENGVITADSMTARGYGTGRRTSFSLYSFTKSDLKLTLLILIPGVISCALMFLGCGDFVFYPSVVLPETGVLLILYYLAFGWLACIPAYLYLEDRLFWKYYLSKI